MKIIFLAYREWAINVKETLINHPKISKVCFCSSEDELRQIDVNNYDLLITCGWSDELPHFIDSKIEAIGVHCAELDRYSYGTPLQLQIIDGIKRTKHRIFSFTVDEKSKRAHTHNRKYSHEVDLDLSGGMKDVLYQMEATSKVLFNWFIDDYPNIQWKKWPVENVVRPKRVPNDSILSKNELQKMTTEELYNFFRCLEEPYPNGAIEDEIGKLFIHKVSFKKKL